MIPLNRAMKCLFLNRTTFSGIIGGHAGPIGGRAQANYRIDCRFDKDAIEARLRNSARRAASSAPSRAAGRPTFHRAHDTAASLGLKANSVVFYLDPPYIEKANDGTSSRLATRTTGYSRSISTTPSGGSSHTTRSPSSSTYIGACRACVSTASPIAQTCRSGQY
jgi:hypothetical protein